MLPFSDAHAVHPPAQDRTRRLILGCAWALVAVFMVGVPATFLVSRDSDAIRYTAKGALWIDGEVGVGSTDPMPTRPESPLWSGDCLTSLCSPRVLHSVILDRRLHLRIPDAYADAFASFRVVDRFESGTYQLRVGGVTGDQFMLADERGSLIQTGRMGSPIGEHLGFRWLPLADAFAPGATVEFSVTSLDQVARDLSARLETATEAGGNLLHVSLTGADPREVVDLLDALMDRYVDVAAEESRFDLSDARSDGPLSDFLEVVERMKRAGRVETRAVRCRFGDRVYDLQVDRSTPAVTLPVRGRAEPVAGVEPAGPGVRILDNAAVRNRRGRHTRLPVTALTFLGCFCLAFGGGLRLSRTAVMDGGDL